MKICRLIPYFLLFIALSASAEMVYQNPSKDKNTSTLEAEIASMKADIATAEKELSQIRQQKASNEQRAKLITGQIDKRNRLINTTAKKAKGISGEISRADKQTASLKKELAHNREQYAEMVREAYRNYKHDNYLTYIFASRSFADVARKITNLRAVASMRQDKIKAIDSLTGQIAIEKEKLTIRKNQLDSVKKDLASERQKLQTDVNAARAEVRTMSKKERAALDGINETKRGLEQAVAELRKLTKGNTDGDSFSSRTSGLRLPVREGRVKRYKENMAEICGPQGAEVISIYEGKIVDIKRNRISNKYDVFVAHGEYISSYANLESVSVAKGQKVAKNGTIGIIGSSVDIKTMAPEYKMIFGIYPPNPSQQMRAEECFRK